MISALRISESSLHASLSQSPVPARVPKSPQRSCSSDPCGTAQALPLDAISCLGAFRTPAGGARGEISAAGVQKPAQQPTLQLRRPKRKSPSNRQGSFRNQMGRAWSYFFSTKICLHSASPVFSAECEAITGTDWTVPALPPATTVLPSARYNLVGQSVTL